MLERDKELLDTVCAIVACEYRDIPDRLRDQLEKAISDHSRESTMQYAQIRWTPEDIVSHAQDSCDIEITHEEAMNFLSQNAKYICSGTIEHGWGIIADLLGSFLAEMEVEKAEAMADNIKDR